jgi:hypothetical protein
MQMKRTYLNALAGAGLLLVMAFTASQVASSGEEARPQAKGKLAVVWTSGDPEVAHRMVFMYTHNAKRAGWFDEVQLVIWGPSQRLLVGDKDIEAKVKAMKADGVVVRACIACARSYGLVEKLRTMGIEVLAMGQPLTELLKSDWKVLSF